MKIIVVCVSVFSILIGFCLGFACCYMGMQRQLKAREKAVQQWEEINRQERQAIADMKSIEIDQLKSWMATLDDQHTSYAELQRLLRSQERQLSSPPITLIVFASLIVLLVVGAIALIVRDANAQAETTIKSVVGQLPPELKQVILESQSPQLLDQMRARVASHNDKKQLEVDEVSSS